MIRFQKTKCISNRPVSLFNDQPNDYLDNSEGLTQSYSGLKVAKFINDECNSSIKSVKRHPIAKNNERNLIAHAIWVEKWLQKGICGFQNCVFMMNHCLI